MRVSSDTWLAIISGKRRGLLAGIARGGLRLASWGYAAAICFRNKCYDWHWKSIHRAEAPVVVVGNLSVGGTGKTPTVEYLARFFRQLNRQVAILSRGYGVQTSRNDEALVLEANLNDVPHLQHPDRVAIAQTAVEELESDLIILDDGFQHRRLHRDLDVVLLDATNPWGYGYCLPRGLLREPPAVLRRADIILITRSDQVNPEQLTALTEAIRRQAPAAIVAESSHRPQALENTSTHQPIEALVNQKVAAFCGIGNPDGFFTTLRCLGADILEQRTFPDHFSYQREDVARLEDWASTLPDGTWMVTTQKDFVKLRADKLGGRPLWSLRIALEITQGQEAFHAALLRVLTPVMDSFAPDSPSESKTSPGSLNLPLTQGCS